MPTTITPKIVNLSGYLTVAPTPSQLQQSGAVISLGGTTLTTGTYQFISQVSDLTSILSTLGNYVDLTNAANTFFAQGNVVGFYVLELGVQTTVGGGVDALQTWINDNPGVFYSYLTPKSWDAEDAVSFITITDGGTGYTTAPTVTISAPTSGTTATATASINSSGVVTSVTVTNPGSGYTTTPTVTFSAPTSGTAATGTATLGSALNILSGNYSSPTGRTYFFGTTVLANIGFYSANKSLFMVAESPSAPGTEFTAAAFFYQWLVNLPSATNMLAPMSYRYLYGVTPWNPSGNQATMTTLLSAYINIVDTGAEGGISNSCIFKGTTMDGSQASWWYGVDWFQIQAKQAQAAEVINGSNSQPRLLYDQNGVNALLGVANQVGKNAVSFGCALSVAIVATPFYTYSNANPGNYKDGVYGGFLASVTGQNGFLVINFILDAIQFA